MARLNAKWDNFTRRHAWDRFWQEAAPAVGVTEVPAGDSGAGSEGLSLAASVPVADAAAGADVAALTTQAAGSDSATGTDAASLAAAVPWIDSGSGADALAVSASADGIDDGIGSDAAALTVSLAVSDTAAGADDAALDAGDVPIVGSDAAAAIDASELSATAAVDEAGVGADDAVLAVQVALADAATGTDSAAVETGASIQVTLEDHAVGSDHASVTAGSESPVVRPATTYDYTLGVMPRIPRMLPQRKAGETADVAVGWATAKVQALAEASDAAVASATLGIEKHDPDLERLTLALAIE